MRLVTYRYVLIVGGRQEGKPLASTREVLAAINQYSTEHRASAARVMVGRLVQEAATQMHGRGVFSAEAFEPGAPNPDLDHLYWHQRVRDVINARLEPRTHFLWLNVIAGDGNSELDENAFLRELSSWVIRLGQARMRNELSREEREQLHADENEFSWQRGGLAVHLTAIESRPGAAPLREIVGNPEPAFAFYAND